MKGNVCSRKYPPKISIAKANKVNRILWMSCISKLDARREATAFVVVPGPGLPLGRLRQNSEPAILAVAKEQQIVSCLNGMAIGIFLVPKTRMNGIFSLKLQYFFLALRTRGVGVIYSSAELNKQKCLEPTLNCTTVHYL